MKYLYLAMERELLVVSQQKGVWQVEPQLVGMQPTCLAVDPVHTERLYCGTFHRGLWRSSDAGKHWEPVGDAGVALAPWNGEGIAFDSVTSVAVSSSEQSAGYGVVYAGTEPTALFRSEDGGETWHECKALRELPSSSIWSFPPRPYTSHARWITPDPGVAGRLFVAIEAGALVRSTDGGVHWEDRQPDGPIDTHTLLMHTREPNRLYSVAGDGFMLHGRGYNESLDGGITWQRPDDGLQHHYLWSLALDPASSNTLVISASHTPANAHNTTGSANSVVYRKQSGGEAWQQITAGLPEAEGTVIPVLASHPAEAGVFYMLCNKGLYRSPDSGLNWEMIPLHWKEEYLHQHQQALAISET